MTDHKFTDEEIIKAMKHCSREVFGLCKECPLRDYSSCTEIICEHALALINRQKAEIERLNAVHADMTESLRLAAEANKDMQAEIKRLIKANNRDDLQHKYCNLIGDVLVYSKSLEDYNKFRKLFKAEAIKEFAQRLKPKLSYYDEVYVDTLVKEMTEEQQ